MTNPSKLRRVCAFAVLGLLAATVTSCSSEEQFLFFLVASSKRATVVRANVQGGPSDASLARLARCESGGNPRAVSRSGSYHGLYQFDQRTWNGVARSVMPTYVGVRPSAAPADVQDAMARALYKARGRSPWPVCGRNL